MIICSYAVEQRPKLRRLTASRPQLGQRNEKHKVSLNLTKSSEDDDQCNLEVFKTLCRSGSSSQMTGSPTDADGIASTIRSENLRFQIVDIFDLFSKKHFHIINLQFIIQFY